MGYKINKKTILGIGGHFWKASLNKWKITLK